MPLFGDENPAQNENPFERAFLASRFSDAIRGGGGAAATPEDESMLVEFVPVRLEAATSPVNVPTEQVDLDQAILNSPVSVRSLNSPLIETLQVFSAPAEHPNRPHVHYRLTRLILPMHTMCNCLNI